MFMINYELVYGKRKVASGHAATASVPCTPQVQIIPVNNPVPTTETNQTAEALSALTVAAKSAASTLSTGISRLGEKAAERIAELKERNKASLSATEEEQPEQPAVYASVPQESEEQWVFAADQAADAGLGEELPDALPENVASADMRYEKLRRRTTTIVICSVLTIVALCIAILAIVSKPEEPESPTQLAAVPVVTTIQATELQTTTVMTTATEETTTTETEAPVEEAVVVRKTTSAPVEDEPEDEPDPEPVKTESPEVDTKQNKYPKEKNVPDEYHTYTEIANYSNREFYAETICDITEIYTWPSNYCVALEKLEPGTKVRVYNMSQNWCAVAVTGTTRLSGFVRRSSLKMLGESDMDEYSIADNYWKCVITDIACIYKTPDTFDDVLIDLVFNDRVTILREGWYWCYCEYTDYSWNTVTGYIQSYQIY